MLKNYVSLISSEECLKFLKLVYGEESNITLTNEMHITKYYRGFGFKVSCKKNNFQEEIGYIDFKLFSSGTCLVCKKTGEFVNTDYSSEYNKFVYNLIQQKNKDGDFEYSCEEYKKEYQEYFRERFSRMM